MRKKIIWLFVLIFPLTILTSCGRRAHRTYRDEESVNELPVENNDNGSLDEDNNQNKEETNRFEFDEENNYDEWIGTGKYEEKIDNRKIIIEMDEEKEEYVLTEWALDDLEEFETGDEISFYYFTEESELIIDEVRDSDFDWEKEYGLDTRYNHHHHSKNHHRRNERHHDRRDNRRRHLKHR